MPKKARSRPEQKPNPFVLWIESRTGRRMGIYQGDVAKAIGLGRAAFSKRMDTGKFDYLELVSMFRYLGATDGEILKLMRGGK